MIQRKVVRSPERRWERTILSQEHYQDVCGVVTLPHVHPPFPYVHLVKIPLDLKAMLCFTQGPDADLEMGHA